MYEWLYSFRRPAHPWSKSYIMTHDVDELLDIHNEMYFYLQSTPQTSPQASLVRATATLIEEHLRAHGALMLAGGVGSGGNINMQLSAPAPPQAPPQVQAQQPAQQNIVYHEQTVSPAPVAQQQPAQQNTVFHEQVLPQQTVVYQQQPQPQVFNIPAPVATLTVTSTPVQRIVVGGFRTPSIGFVRTRRFGLRSLYDSDDSD
jgi:hypothetical protein